MTLPFLKCFFGILGKTEIRNPREALLDPVVPVGPQQFQRSQNAQHVEQIAAYLVLSALAAIQRQQQGVHALPSRLQREHAAIFVIRMRYGLHQAGSCPQP